MAMKVQLKKAVVVERTQLALRAFSLELEMKAITIHAVLYGTDAQGNPVGEEQMAIRMRGEQYTKALDYLLPEEVTWTDPREKLMTRLLHLVKRNLEEQGKLALGELSDETDEDLPPEEMVTVGNEPPTPWSILRNPIPK